MAVTALETFNSMHDRAKVLLDLHSSGGAGRPRKDKEDILRAAVVMAVAGVDSYFHAKILERLTPSLIMRKGKDVPGNLVKVLNESGGVQKLLGIMYEERPHRHIHTLVRKHLADVTFQKPDKIENGLKYLGVNDFWFETAQKMTTRMSRDALKDRVARYADRRDQIAHEGDHVGRRRLRPIKRAYVRTCLDFLKDFVEAADPVINAKTEP